MLFHSSQTLTLKLAHKHSDRQSSLVDLRKPQTGLLGLHGMIIYMLEFSSKGISGHDEEGVFHKETVVEAVRRHLRQVH